MLPQSDLLKLAKWRPIASGFGRDTNDTYETRVKPIFRKIETLDGAEVRIISDGGLSNYASAFVHDRKGESGNISGLYIYLSLLAPLAAIGHGIAYLSEKSQGYSMIEPAAVLELQQLNRPFDSFVWNTVQESGFTFLSQAEATAPLPSNVVSFEYCLNDEPWDRVFHVLFSDTD